MSITMPTRRQLLSMIGHAAGTTAMYQAMTSMGFAATSDYSGPIELAGSQGGTKVLILGAGLAGLTAAYELRKAGYDVKVLEYQNRGGGRSWTISGGDSFTELGGHDVDCTFEKGYLNPGPWRLPIHHYAVFDYCRKFNVPLQPFIMKNNKAYLHNSQAYGGKPQRIGDVETDIRGYTSELLAKSVQQGALDEQVSAEDQEKLLEGLKGWGVLDKNYRYVTSEAVGEHRGWDVLPGGGLMPKAEPSTPLDFGPLLNSGLWEQLYVFNEYVHAPAMFEPVGGMGRIGDAFTEQTRDLIRFNARVSKIEQNEGQVTVHYEDREGGGEVMQETADYCICTIPLSILAQLEIDVSDEMKRAIASVPYASAFKVALEFKRRFWEQDEWIVGGISYTDLPIKQIAYPSYDLFEDGPGVVQAAYDTYPTKNYTYTWNTLTPQERIEAALEFGSRIHPQYREEFISGTSCAWHRIPWTLGCYGQWTEELREEHYETLCEFDGRIALAGEHCSHIPAWQEGAILSGLDVIRRLDARVNA
ncbi:flavin monoamine oxidase family protein [Marivita sp. GX14005]|uniref:flavin monoamine oxidase family protein n=1 Tax=Marivita sp. GX14005 TaxID=2942276 RepID=UPI00201964F1|nr:flavin monoamine oxidase family protein [Marivita sp. GX14005]MCL3883579.1 flavin monoamine oxidase family protein [Marivita sp. GX14005]